MRNTSYGRIDALAQTGEVSIPLVIIRNTTENVSIPYIGFIPGFLMKNVNGHTVDECKTKLKEYLVKKLKMMKQNDEPFPFFPTKEEIMKDYDNVEIVEFIKVTSKDRKN